MLNCSTCHKKKPEAHFYANPSHRAHIPVNASPEDGEALARLLADGLIADTTARQTPARARATLASAREQLATSGRPVESEAQRRQREAAQSRAVEREEADAYQRELEATIDKWALGGLFAGGLAFVGWAVWATWRGGASA